MSTPPILGIVGHSGVGKTTLLTALLPMFLARGIRVAVIKHTHPDFEIDYPGKDSRKLRAAGAAQVLLATPGRWALLAESQMPAVKSLDYWLARLPAGEQELVLLEGFKTAPVPKLEIYRPELGKPVLCRSDSTIKAFASTPSYLDWPRPLPCFDMTDYPKILDWILSFTALGAHDR
jgi:molybdopterin-guanine dinucleotide biosynthesis protein B